MLEFFLLYWKGKHLWLVISLVAGSVCWHVFISSCNHEMWKQNFNDTLLCEEFLNNVAFSVVANFITSF